MDHAFGHNIPLQFLEMNSWETTIMKRAFSSLIGKLAANRLAASGLAIGGVTTGTVAALTMSFTALAPPSSAVQAAVTSDFSSLGSSVEAGIDLSLPHQNAQWSEDTDHWIAQFWRRRFRVRSSAYRRGGFSRGASCPVNEQITALTPFVDENDSPLAGVAPRYLSASSRPHFFFHMPELMATKGILTVQSEDTTLNLTERYFYSTEFDVQGEAGIVGIRLPDDAPALEIGQTYVWSVAVACNPDNIRDSLRVHGGVLERVADVGVGASDRLEAYADQGIWQEPLSILAQEYYANPEDGAIASNWADLLNSVGLDPAITTAPIVQIMDGQ